MNGTGLGPPRPRVVTLSELYGKPYPLILSIDRLLEGNHLPMSKPLSRDEILNTDWTLVVQTFALIAFGPEDMVAEFERARTEVKRPLHPRTFKKNRLVEGVSLEGTFLIQGPLRGYAPGDNVWQLSVDYAVNRNRK